jgi:hypothetical protein
MPTTTNQERPMTRSQLAERIAIARAVYESDTLAKGYTPAHFDSMVNFCRWTTKGLLASGRRVRGCSYRPDTGYGASYTMPVDWQALAKAVERQLPRWRQVVARNA